MSIVKKCEKCGNEFLAERKITKYCEECLIKMGRISLNEQVKMHPEMLNTLKKDYDYVVCEICGFISGCLNSHIRYEHKISVDEYKKQFPNAKLTCDKEHQIRSEKFKGSNNPAYQHGGKQSPWSYKNKSKSKEEIDECRKKTKESIRNSDKLDTRLDYWLKLTNGNEEEAKELLRNRQTTFSLEKCIEKHGKAEGKRVWKERQDKWQNTINSKSEEELAEINRKKLNINSISKAEKELGFILSEKLHIETQKVLRTGSKYYLYDIAYKNKIIEYNGDFWHASELRYNDTDNVRRDGKNSNKFITAKEIRNHDAQKIKCAKDNGYEVLVIWEHEYKKDKNDVIKRCYEFLTKNEENNKQSSLNEFF